MACRMGDGQTTSDFHCDGIDAAASISPLKTCALSVKDAILRSQEMLKVLWKNC